MISKIKKVLNQRKVNIFLVFLLCSSIIWLISNLSESYINTTTFNLTYSNAPDSLLLVKSPRDKIDVKLRASGFQFLGYNFRNKRINLNLNNVQKRGLTYFVPQQEYKKQIDRQLSKNMELLDIDSDTLYFEFERLYTKSIPVEPRIGISLAQNFMLEGKLLIQPDTISITGPKNEVDTIAKVWTRELDLREISSDFSQKVGLMEYVDLKNTVFSTNEVTISGKVSRFSEKIIDVPVTVKNLPESIQIRTFPKVISILCKGKMEELKNLKPEDFELVADYNSILNSQDNMLLLELAKSPESLHSARPLEHQVEYILKRE